MDRSRIFVSFTFYLQLLLNLIGDAWCMTRRRMASKQETISSPAMQKISDLEERVHYLEDQNLTVRKALETALNQNKYLEDRLENLGKITTPSIVFPNEFFLFSNQSFKVDPSLTQVHEWGKLKTELKWGNHLKKTSWSCWNSTRTSSWGSRCWRPSSRRIW